MIESNFKQIPFTKEEWEFNVALFDAPSEKVKRKSMVNNFLPKIQKTFSDLPNIIGIDTETYQENGNLICLCNSENNTVLYGGTKYEELPTIKDIFNYLRRLKRHKEGTTIFFAYNLGFDARIILKSLKEKIIKFYNGEDEQYEIKIKGLQIKYLNKKYLKLNDKSNSVEIFDAYQFFIGSGLDGSSSLDQVAKAYKLSGKKYDGIYKDKKFPSKISGLEMKKIVDYCIDDSKLTKNLMKIWIKNFKKNFNFYPSKYYSCGNLALEYVYKEIPKMINFMDIEYDIQDLAYKSYFGGRFEIFFRGLLKNIYHYDIKSAYPYAMMFLPDFRNGVWVHLDSLDEFVKNCKYVGFYEIETTVDEKNICPFMFRTQTGKVICPNGFFKTCVTCFELKVAIESYNVKIHKISGYYFIPNETVKTDFNEHIQKMFNARLSQTNKGQKYIYKILLNSVYGKFAQVKPKPKGVFNPVMCSAITGFCRAMLLDAVKENKESIVMFATDAIFSKVQLDKLVLTKDQLGAFEKEFHSKMKIVMAGIYANNFKVGSKMTTKTRGFTAKCISKKTGKRYTFEADSAKIILRDDKLVFRIENNRSIGIPQAIIQDDFTIKDIGKFEVLEKFIDINGDSKRLWFDKLKTLNDTNESMPILLG